jgi:hypothetical protein
VQDEVLTQHGVQAHELPHDTLGLGGPLHVAEHLPLRQAMFIPVHASAAHFAAHEASPHCSRTSPHASRPSHVTEQPNFGGHWMTLVSHASTPLQTIEHA